MNLAIRRKTKASLITNEDGTAFYVTGTFTPVFTFATPGNLSVAYTSALGKYTKIGNRVFIDINLAFTPTFTTSSGEPKITGLPFTSANDSHPVRAIVSSWSQINLDANYTVVAGRIGANVSDIQLLQCGDNTAFPLLAASNITSGVAMNLVFQISYTI